MTKEADVRPPETFDGLSADGLILRGKNAGRHDGRQMTEPRLPSSAPY
jgi:hypothetical protein